MLSKIRSRLSAIDPAQQSQEHVPEDLKFGQRRFDQSPFLSVLFEPADFGADRSQHLLHALFGCCVSFVFSLFLAAATAAGVAHGHYSGYLLSWAGPPALAGDVLNRAIATVMPSSLPSPPE